MTRILIDLFFLIIISVIKTIITFNNNNYKILKNNNFHYLKLVDFYKSLMKTQTNLLSRINLVNKTQTLTIMIINFNDDRLLLKYINIMSRIKKTSYQ